MATTCLWLEMDAEERKQRALGRDGNLFAPWWDTWATQEAEHWARHDPVSLAHVVITGQLDD